MTEQIVPDTFRDKALDAANDRMWTMATFYALMDIGEKLQALVEANKPVRLHIANREEAGKIIESSLKPFLRGGNPGSEPE